MTKHMWGKLGLFVTLYISVGLPHGFFRQAAPVIFRQQGLSLEEITVLSQIFSLPWIFKFLWAPIIDHFYVGRFGRYRSWLIPLQLTSAGLFIWLSTWNISASVGLLLLMTFLVNLTSSTQDAAADGYAVEMLDPEERGPGNAAQTGGYYLGFVIGGGFLLVLQGVIGWTYTFYVIAGLIIVLMLPSVFRHEPPPPAHPERGGFVGHFRSLFVDFFTFIKRKNTWRVIVIAGLAKMGMGFSETMVRTMLVDFKYDTADIGWILGIAGPLAGITGAVVSGIWSNKLGRRRSIILFCSLQIIPFGTYFVLTSTGTTGMPYILTAVILEYLVQGMLMVSIFALLMDWSDQEHGSSEYTFMDCMGIIFIIFSAVLAASVSERSGYSANFAVAIGYVVLAAPLIGLIYRRDMTHLEWRDMEEEEQQRLTSV